MTHILTVLCSGSQCNLDQAVALAERLLLNSTLTKFEDGTVWHPVVVEGEDAIEVLCEVGHWRSARQAFKEAGYGLVGDE